jgi:hypothetical protein
MNKILCIFIIFIVFLSCSKKGKESSINLGSTVFPWEQSDEQIASLFDTIEYLPLEPHPDGLFKKADKLMIHNNNYIVFDNYGQNQLNVFDKDGHFLYKIGKKGRGPGEYVGIRNFTVKNNRFYLIDNYVSKLLIYDATNGDFIEDKVLPFYAHDMVVGDDGNYIFAQQKINEAKLPKFQRYNIFITDPDLNIKYSLFPFEEEHCGVRSQLSYFSQTDQSIVFRTMIADSIILFDKQKPSEQYYAWYMDFGSKTVDRKFENDDEIFRKYTYLYSTPIITSKYIVGTYWAGIKLGGPYSCIYDMQEKKVFVNNDNNSRFFFAPLLCVGDTIFSMYNQDYFNYWANRNELPELPEHIMQHLTNGDDVLIKYILK